jgi:hypothetical protein
MLLSVRSSQASRLSSWAFGAGGGGALLVEDVAVFGLIFMRGLGCSPCPIPSCENGFEACGAGCDGGAGAGVWASVGFGEEVPEFEAAGGVDVGRDGAFELEEPPSFASRFALICAGSSSAGLLGGRVWRCTLSASDISGGGWSAMMGCGGI